MILLMLGVAASLMVAEAPPPNPACALLTPAQVTSLIGAARTTPVSSSPMGSACMLQAGDKIVTVLIVHATSPESAIRTFESKKRIASGEAVSGWTLPAYSGSQRTVALLGFREGQTFTEVKLSDPAQTAQTLLVTLTGVMREVAARP